MRRVTHEHHTAFVHHLGVVVKLRVRGDLALGDDCLEQPHQLASGMAAEFLAVERQEPSRHLTYKSLDLFLQ